MDTEDEKQVVATGRKLLVNNDASINDLEVLLDGFENSKRKVLLLKTGKSYAIFRELVCYYGTMAIIDLLEKEGSLQALRDKLPVKPKRLVFENIGGQLIPSLEVQNLLKRINSNRIGSWDEVHDWYREQGESYESHKQLHAIASLKEITGIDLKNAETTVIRDLVKQAVATRTWMLEGIIKSREKDYNNPFRKMVIRFAGGNG
jgi:hypothetical protein